MYDLTSPKVISELCKHYGFSFKKSYGQNFLTDSSVLFKIAEEAGKEGVLEIGPGFGTLTAALAQKAEKVVSVEIDQTLDRVLKDTLAGFDNIKIKFEDIMKTDIEKLISEEFPNKKVSVAANLPYYVTTPILMKLLEGEYPFEKIIVMVQKEVAERIVAKPGGKDYGAITLAVEYYSEPEIIAYVPAESFVPSPKVDSAVVSMRIRSKPPVDVDKKMFFRVVKASFAQRRKTLANSLANGGICSKEKLNEITEKMGYDGNVRGETLGIEDFAYITNELKR